VQGVRCVLAATVVANQGRRCWGVGPNYWRTFDGLEFLFSGRCVYTLFSNGICTITVDMTRCSSFANCRKVTADYTLAVRKLAKPSNITSSTRPGTV